MAFSALFFFTRCIARRSFVLHNVSVSRVSQERFDLELPNFTHPYQPTLQPCRIICRWLRPVAIEYYIKVR